MVYDGLNNFFVAHLISVIEPSDCEKWNKADEFVEKKTHTKMAHMLVQLGLEIFTLCYPAEVVKS